jgi:hypothetical protein
MRSGIEPVPTPPSRGRLALMSEDTLDQLNPTGRAAARLTPFKRMELGVRAASRYMYQQDKVWARYSNDKVDVGDTLTTTLRTLSKALPLEAPLSVLSIGSSTEPQFRILQSACRGGLYLLDQEETALQLVEERIARQNIRHVGLIRGDYRDVLREEHAVRLFAIASCTGSICPWFCCTTRSTTAGEKPGTICWPTCTNICSRRNSTPGYRGRSTR